MKKYLKIPLQAFALGSVLSYSGVSEADKLGATRETAYDTKEDGLYEIVRDVSWREKNPGWLARFFGADVGSIKIGERFVSEKLVCPKPKPTALVILEDKDPASVYLEGLQHIRDQKNWENFLRCVRKFSPIEYEILESTDAPENDAIAVAEIVGKNIPFQGEIAQGKGAEAAKRDADAKIAQENSEAEYGRAAQLAAARPGSCSANFNNNNPVNNQQAAATYPSPLGPWVQKEVKLNYLSEDFLRKLREKLPEIGERGAFLDYNVRLVGEVTFPDCEFRNGAGIDAVAGKLKDYGLQEKIVVLYGSADGRSGEKCPSGNNEHLSGHRAISTLINLEHRLGGHLHGAHVDFIAGGEELNERTVRVYLLEENNIRNISNPLDVF